MIGDAGGVADGGPNPLLLSSGGYYRAGVETQTPTRLDPNPKTPAVLVFSIREMRANRLFPIYIASSYIKNQPPRNGKSAHQGADSACVICRDKNNGRHFATTQNFTRRTANVSTMSVILIIPSAHANATILCLVAQVF